MKISAREGVFYIEDDILLYIQNHIRNESLDKIMKFITVLGDKGILWGSAAVLLAASEKHKKTGIKLGTALGIGAVITNLATKNTIRRPRPFEAIDGLLPLIPPPADWSFPSGHTTSSVACGTLLLMHMPKKIGIPSFITGIMISLSRIYVGVHYPSDVLAGAAAGVIAAVVSDKAVDKYFSPDRRCGKRLKYLK